MLGRSAGGDVQRTSVFARALFAGEVFSGKHAMILQGDAPLQTAGVGVDFHACSLRSHPPG
jgi:hypothetical protein